MRPFNVPEMSSVRLIDKFKDKKRLKLDKNFKILAFDISVIFFTK